jgi:pyruvate/2-oxoglutarate dehydrogenase complex dihydrolipoamide dehydrogenase (E3) component
MDVKQVGVIGIGTMGSGIAIVSLSAGLKTIVADRDEAILKDGASRIEKFFLKGVEKGKLTARERIDLLLDKGSFHEVGLYGQTRGRSYTSSSFGCRGRPRIRFRAASVWE